MSKYDNLKLNETLLKQIGNLIDGNNVRATDILEKSHEILEFSTNLNVVWNFKGEYEDKEVVGGSKASVHFGYNQKEFTNYTQELLENCKIDENLRKEFLSNLENLEASGLKESEDSKIFYKFKPFSVSYKCSTCGGEGTNICGSCWGSGTSKCNTCSGSGTISELQTIYDNNGQYAGTRTIYRTCYSCNGSGKRTCHNCHGRGVLKCSSCSGYGYFTITRNIFAIAIPQPTISVKSSEFAENLSDFLVLKGVEFCGEKIHFELIDNLKIDKDSHAFKYFGQSMITKLNFRLLDKDYMAVAMSNPPYAFLKPAIFDDIFFDEIAFLKKIDKDSKITRAEAYSFFSKYQNQPVLDLAMQKIAKARKNENDDMGDMVLKACDGYISNDTAAVFANLINKCLDKISPVYSKFIWIIFGFLASLVALLCSENIFEKSFELSPFKTIFNGILVVLIAIVVFGIIAYFLSSIVTFIKRLKIAPQYRQKMRNKEAFSRFKNAVAIFGIVGAIYGGLASYEMVFKLNDRVEIAIKSASFKAQNEICKSNNFQFTMCKEIIFLEDLGKEFNTISKKEKYLSIQNLLINNGFKIKADGVWGKKSSTALSEYMSENFPNIKLQNFDDIYTYLKLSKNMP